MSIHPVEPHWFAAYLICTEPFSYEKCTHASLELHEFGLEHVRLDEVPVPVPSPDEVLIRVGAVALNFRDKAIIEGFYNPDMLKPGPLILVGDAVGIVVETGRDITRVNVGDRVTSHLYSHWEDGAPRNDEADYTLGGPLTAKKSCVWVVAGS